MENKQNFWTKQKVLITGAGGFVGARLAHKLALAGAEVVAVVLNQRDRLADLAGATLEVCDLTDLPLTLELFKKRQITSVFHLAASSVVREAITNPWQTVQNNVQATLNILEAGRLNKVERVLLASSDKAYGDHAIDELEGLPYNESYALRGMDIYSASKVCADTLAQAYAFQYKIPIAVLRFCNIFGPGDANFTRLIPRAAMQFLSGEQPVIFAGHEKVLREYIYIDDAVNAYLFLAEKIQSYYGENFSNMPAKGKETYGWIAFNVGSYTQVQTQKLGLCQNIKSVSKVIEALEKKIPGLSPKVVERRAQYIEIPDEYLDSAKIISLGFKTQVDFEQGLDSAVNWYKANFEKLKGGFKRVYA